MSVTACNIRSAGGHQIKFGGHRIKTLASIIRVNITGTFENVSFVQTEYTIASNTPYTIPVTWINGSDATCVSASVGTFTQNGLELPAMLSNVVITVSDTKHRVSVSLEDTTAVSAVTPTQVFLQQGDTATFTLTYNTGYTDADLYVVGGTVQGNTLTATASSASSVVTVSTKTASTYTYFKLDVTAKRSTSEDPYFQLSELELYDENGTQIPLTYVTGTAGNSSSESGDKMCDGSTSTKFCAWFPSDGIYQIFRTSVPSTVSYYRLATANDTSSYPGRNPATWTLCASLGEITDRASTNWDVIDSRTNDTTMGAVNYTFYTFTINGD